MPQMAPINWTLIYIIIIFLYLTMAILNFFLFISETRSPSHKTNRKTKFWK
uniref:ATP synthase complex subunit 8 n=1 Tax=Trigonopterus puspoi TaxID=2896828 RepID=A0A7H1KHV6_9CUCU|nr:ATP synthase F0 subunit 8 [Trigonopterus puspoi]